MSQYISKKENQVSSPVGRLHEIFGIFLVIVPIMGLSYFTFFIYGLISSAGLTNKNIDFKQSLVEINVHDITKNMEMLNHFVERHLLESEEEERSRIMSVRKQEEYEVKKRQYLEKKNERLNEIQTRLKIIKKRREESMVALRENGEKLVINKYTIKQAERYLNDLVWLSVFSLLVMCLGRVMTKVSFK